MGRDDEDGSGRACAGPKGTSVGGTVVAFGSVLVEVFEAGGAEADVGVEPCKGNDSAGG